MLNFNQWILESESAQTGVNKISIDSVIAATGYSGAAAKIAKIIATKEGWDPKPNDGKGTRAYRNNNPGNLDYQEDFKTIDSGVIVETMLDGKTKGRYAHFSRPDLGAKALIEKKILKWANGNMPVTSSNSTLIVTNKGGKKYEKGTKPTVAQFFYTYAPPNENDTEKYIKDFLAGVKPFKPTATRDTLVADLLS